MTVAVFLLLLSIAAIGIAFAAEPVRRGLPTALFASAAVATVLAALGASEVMPDGERRPVDGAKLVGLLLGAPEFQNQ